MKKIILLSVCLFCITSTAFADITKFSITTPPQTVLPNALSGPITIQSQNSSNKEEAITETVDLDFKSSSPTGEFIGSTGKPVSKTMAKGTANRTFYYRDTNLGEYILSIIALGRTSHQSFSVTQQIIVSSTTQQKIIPKTIISTPKQKTINQATLKPNNNSISNIEKPILNQATSSSQSSSTGNLAIVYEGKTETNLFDSILDWPFKFWNWFSNIF